MSDCKRKFQGSFKAYAGQTHLKNLGTLTSSPLYPLAPPGGCRCDLGRTVTAQYLRLEKLIPIVISTYLNNWLIEK